MGIDDLVRLLGERGYRDSRPRRVVLAIIVGSRGSFTAQGIVDRVRDAGVGRATVFRTIALLQEAGALVRLHDEGDCSRYLLDAGPPHHLVCTGCGYVAQLELGELGSIVARAASRTGFKIERQSFGAYGLCANCQAAS